MSSDLVSFFTTCHHYNFSISHTFKDKQFKGTIQYDEDLNPFLDTMKEHIRIIITQKLINLLLFLSTFFINLPTSTPVVLWFNCHSLSWLGYFVLMWMEGWIYLVRTEISAPTPWRPHFTPGMIQFCDQKLKMFCLFWNIYN